MLIDAVIKDKALGFDTVSRDTIGPNVDKALEEFAFSYKHKCIEVGSSCKGITDSNCGYMCKCGEVCPKCGKVHDGLFGLKQKCS